MKTESRELYDTRQKAKLDEAWRMRAAERKGHAEGFEEGEIKGEIRLIHALQNILQVPVSDASSLEGQSLEQLRAMTIELQNRIQRHTSSCPKVIKRRLTTLGRTIKGGRRL